jgi:hypothetical protein
MCLLLFACPSKEQAQFFSRVPGFETTFGVEVFRPSPPFYEMLQGQTFLHIPKSWKITHPDRWAELCIHLTLLTHEIFIEII